MMRLTREMLNDWAIGWVQTKSTLSSLWVLTNSARTTMTTKRLNDHLGAAKAKKNDEFYTQWATIEQEMNAYLEYDPDVFKDKVILLPCDDPEWSNFTKFFALHFVNYGIKKLISTSYAPRSNANVSTDDYEPTLLEVEDPKFDPEKAKSRGKMFILEPADVNGDGAVNIDDLRWEYLEGDGDFQSPEVTQLRDEADIVITNPPFSLFRTFISWLTEGEKKFAVIGTSNATTYKEIFRLIKSEQLWKGVTGNNSDMVFAVPKGANIKKSDRLKAEKLGYKSDGNYNYTRLGNSCWFTNIDHGRRHQPLQLMTMDDNLKFSKTRDVRESGYLPYENYDAIEVPSVSAIPSNYDGVMGVPIGYLDHHTPDQFEIVGTTESNDPDNAFRTRWYSAEERREAYLRRFGKDGSYDLNSSGVVNGVKKFKRILIRRKDTA